MNWKAIILAIIYSAGLMGIISPETKNQFLEFTPLIILISAILLIKKNKKTINYFIISFLAGFILEAIGANTGIIFGEYAYGTRLGFKLFGVPLLIGVNWFCLTYSTGIILKKIKKPWIKALTGSAFLTLFDWILEIAAEKLGFWNWQQNNPPISNYIWWFIISYALLLIHSKILKKEKNKTALPYLIITTVFFTIIATIL